MAQDDLGLTASPAVRVRKLVRRFGERVILDNIDLDVRQGEFVALLGRSGSGKSTFLKALARIDHGVTGSGRLTVPAEISVAFQDARLLPWKRVLENVVFGLRGADPVGRARAILEEVGLAGREKAWPSELSGGEQQRVALARSLARQPQLLLADEPFGALDALTRLRMHVLLRRLYAHHKPAVLLVTHDVDEAINLAQRIIVLDTGRLTLDIAVDLPPKYPERDHKRREIRLSLLESLGVQSEDDAA
ncbi:ABC transporter ATP-binding protein [Pseudochelatococcus sp. B33]